MTEAQQSDPASDETPRQRFRTAANVGIRIQLLIYVFLYVYIGWHFNPKGDGMEWVAVMPATILLFLGAVPAFVLCRADRLPGLAAALAIIGVAMNVAFFLEVAREFAESAAR
jgi:hypothetical protein